MPNRQAVALRKCQLAGHQRLGPKTKNVSQCLQFVEIAIGSAKVAKKEERKREKREKGKDDRKLIRTT